MTDYEKGETMSTDPDFLTLENIRKQIDARYEYREGSMTDEETIADVFSRLDTAIDSLTELETLAEKLAKAIQDNYILSTIQIEAMDAYEAWKEQRNEGN